MEVTVKHPESCKCASCAKRRVTRTVAFLERLALEPHHLEKPEPTGSLLLQVANWLRQDLRMPRRDGCCIAASCWRDAEPGLDICEGCLIERQALEAV